MLSFSKIHFVLIFFIFYILYFFISYLNSKSINNVIIVTTTTIQPTTTIFKLYKLHFLLYGGEHPKIVEGIKRFHNKYFNISIGEWPTTETEINEMEFVYSPGTYVNPLHFPHIRFIFGPQFSIFATDENEGRLSNCPNAIYIAPSPWIVELYKRGNRCRSCRNGKLKLMALPVPVDTFLFSPSKKNITRDSVFIYKKHRSQSDYNFIESFLTQRNISFKIFNYDRRYDPRVYLNYLKKSKYGIWIGSHESQGLALHEALSTNVPLLVFNVISMRQEVGSHYQDIPASTVTYWDSRCGEIFNKTQDFEFVFSKFIKNLHNYQPRQFELEYMSDQVIGPKYLQIFKSMNITF